MGLFGPKRMFNKSSILGILLKFLDKKGGFCLSIALFWQVF
jgi:hypothetical protein